MCGIYVVPEHSTDMYPQLQKDATPQVNVIAKNSRCENTETRGWSLNRKKSGSAGSQMNWLIRKTPCSLEDLSRTHIQTITTPVGETTRT